MSEEKRQPKTKEELDELKKEVENLRNKLAELTEEELAQVSGGGLPQRRSEFVADPISFLESVDTLQRPPTPSSPVAEPVKAAVGAAL